MLAAGLLTLVGSTSVRAQNDTFRLGGSSGGMDGLVWGGTDTELVRYGHGGHGGHGHMHHGHMHHGHMHHGHMHHGHVGYWGGGYRQWGYGYGGYGGGYRQWGYGYGGYGGYAGYYRPYGYGYGGYWPCSLTASESPPMYYYPMAGQGVAPATPATVYTLQAPADNPSQFQLTPQVETTGGTTPLFATQFIGLGTPAPATNASAAPASNTLSYPAYGEQSLPPVTRKQTR
jgi:hypothetical protein